MIPVHIGFIMDGNGRWAVSKGLNREEGYYHGYLALLKVAKACQSKSINTLTFYAFSTENNLRPSIEINSIFGVIMDFNYSQIKDFKIHYFGKLDELPKPLLDSIKYVEKHTFNNQGLNINIALNYGGRDDIINAVKKCVLNPELNTKELFEQSLSSYGLPDLDLIVRTGGEKRLSNFLLYESAYSELIFLDKYWPDIDENDIDNIINDFTKIERKFGK